MNELTTVIKAGEISANFEKIKAQLQTELTRYDIVFTDDTIKEAKQSRAELNKLKDKIDTQRKDTKKEWLKPFDEFEAGCKDLVKLIDITTIKIDAQVKDFEQRQKDEKRAKLETVWSRLKWSDRVPFNNIFKDKWLNATTSMASIGEELQAIVDMISRDLQTISNLPGFDTKMENLYFENLSITQCVELSNTLQSYNIPVAKWEAPQEAPIFNFEQDLFADFPSANKTYTVEVPEHLIDKFEIYCRINEIIVKEKR